MVVLDGTNVGRLLNSLLGVSILVSSALLYSLEHSSSPLSQILSLYDHHQDFIFLRRLIVSLMVPIALVPFG